MHRILFQIGPVTLYSYGFFVAIAFLVAAIFILRDSKKAGFSKEFAFDGLLAILIGGLIGGRLLYVLINWQYYIHQPLRIFLVYEGGLAFQGALFMAVIFGVIICWKRKVSFWKASDLFAPYIALGQAIGRIGCFFNGCCYGKIVDNSFGVMFPHEVVKRFPIQLGYCAVLFIIFILLFVMRNKKSFSGQLFSCYLILYGLLRVFMDFFRGDELVSVGPMHLSQIIGIVVAVFGTGLYFFLRKRTV